MNPTEPAPPNQQIADVKKIFSHITPHYDRMNHLLSAGQDLLWRKFTVSKLPPDARKVLDLAAGTGDLALEIARKKPLCEVVGVDFVPPMMELAKQKAVKKKLKLRLAAGDAMNLPFPDNTFDAATIAFGLRNIPDRLGAIKEMGRVVKPGGKVLTLEMTFPKNIKMRAFFGWYLNNVIPLLGGIIAKNKGAYNYLSSSIREFLHPEELSEIFRGAGLIQIKVYPLTFGITYLHCGTVGKE